MKCIKHYITSKFPKLGFVKELQGVVSLMKSWQLIESQNFKTPIPFEETLFTWWPYFQRLRAARTSPILMNGGILKSQTLLAELTIQLHMSNQQHKSEMNCPVNLASCAQIAFKKHIFRLDQPMHTWRHVLVTSDVGWSSQVSRGNVALSFRRWDYSSLLRVAVSPVHKYRSEPSFYFYSLCFK